ncbi:MAG: CoA transferase [Rhodospirillales bacterium]|nr:CoA transferase [Rhodospirillales bacterium]
MNKALHNIRVLDLSRVLAGPYCTQMLGDLGAEIIKVEKPGDGDDTRTWGPPFLQDVQGSDTSESAYYLSCNRNKKSIAIDLTTPKGQGIIKSLIAQCDIVIENFKVGGLKKYGLDYESLKKDHPTLIYCSITGFGQTGPLAPEPGYDFLAQAMAGLMACTGEPDGSPMKVGVALSDIMTGLNAAVGILAALHARKHSGQGQHIDVALSDCTLAGLTNIAQYYLTSGQCAPRMGNAHSTIVPYQAFEARDGHVILAVGNNDQFKRFCDFTGHGSWAEDERFATNSARVLHRETLVPMIAETIAAKDMAHWIEGLHKIDVPCGPVNTMDKVFEQPQIKARGMEIEMDHPLADAPVHLVGSPLKLSGTPVTYEHAPPVCGQHTHDILSQRLKLSDAEIEALAAEQIIQIS